MTTQKYENMTILEMMGTAVGLLRGCQLDKKIINNEVLKALLTQLHLDNVNEVVSLVVMFERHTTDVTDTDDVAQFLNCNHARGLQFTPAIESLVAKGYCYQDDGINMYNLPQYKLIEDIYDAIVLGQDVHPIPPYTEEGFDQFDFCEAVHIIICKRKRKQIDQKGLVGQVIDLENKHSMLEFVQDAKSMFAETFNRVLLYEICNDFASRIEGGKTNIDSTLSNIYSRAMDRAKERQQLRQGTHPLIQQGIVTMTNNEDEDELILDRNGIHLLFREVAEAYITNYGGMDRYAMVELMVQEDDNTPRRFRRRNKARIDLKQVEAENGELSFVKNLSLQVKDFQSRLIFYHVCCEFMDNNAFRLSALSDFLEQRICMSVRRDFKVGSHVLLQRGLVELTKAGMMDDSALKLTEKGRELFLEEDAEAFCTKTKGENIILPSDIREKHLFYDSELQRQLSLLGKSLEEDRYKELTSRLTDKNLPTGVAALLYGKPGTGKTESVLQLARKTGRIVMHVDISSTKSCWFGESEKMIKDVFDMYRRLCKKTPIKPILLFNEADAIFSKRKDVGRSNVAQTENAIQNIILEEMERLDGILIATTNMADNLDAAFERRFLFKVRFESPTIEAKQQIWLDKMPTLNLDDAHQLATRFALSGGEIDNVVRKAEMEEIVNGIKPTFETISQLCLDEKIGKERRSIGFAC